MAPVTQAVLIVPDEPKETAPPVASVSGDIPIVKV